MSRIKIAEALNVNKLTKVYDLIEYEGPLLSHFIDENENSFLFLWVDTDKITNKWLIWIVEKNNLFNYILGDISLRDLLALKTKDFVVLIDIDNDLNCVKYESVEIDKIPEKYTPELDSFFYESHLVSTNPYYEFFNDIKTKNE